MLNDGFAGNMCRISSRIRPPFRNETSSRIGFSKSEMADGMVYR